MKHFNIWETGCNKFITYENDIYKIIDYINQNKKMDFSVIDEKGLEDGCIPTFLIGKISETSKEQNVDITYVDNEHCFFYDNFGEIYFSKTFFIKNKDILLKTIENIMFQTESVHISKYAYSERLVKNLCLTATTISFDSEIEISNELQRLLKNNHINAYTYKNKDRIEISTNKILGQDYKDVISDSDDIYIKNDITDLENLIYIPKNKTIHISQLNEYEQDNILTEDYDSLYNIIYKLRENNQDNKVIIKIKNRNKFSKSKLYNSNFNFEIEGIDILPYKIDELKKEDQLLDLMIADIKNSNFSLFEKYIAAYNIVKKFKKYLENNNDKTESRYVRKFLNNDYMVCLGYANLLRELLERLGITSYSYGVSADTSYDDGFTLEEKPIELVDHARVIININDPKYNIYGIYVVDPTWDNDLENDYYNHALMSFDKTCYEKRLFRLSFEDLIMNVKDMDEFNNNVNIFIKHTKNSPFNGIFDYAEKENSALKTLLHNIINILISLFPDEYIILKEQFPNILNYDVDSQTVSDFITESAKIFIDNLGKEVSINTIIEAGVNVNKEIFDFTDEQANTYKEHLLESNLKRDRLSFPYYYDVKIK